MTRRDINFIVTRLCDPVGNVTEAHDRLKTCGYYEDAAVLMAAMQTFVATVRPIRYKFEYNEGKES
jgi:hypothetical protein